MSASKGQYTTETVSLSEGMIRTIRLTSDGRLMVDSMGVPSSATLADAVANPSTASLGAYISGFNGTTWDRVRTGKTTPTSTLTGILNGLPWALYHTSPTARTDGQGGPLEADASGNLRVVSDSLKQPTNATAVTISDATDTTSTATKGCWVGTGGDLAVTMVGDSSAVTLKNVPSGTYVPGAFKRIMSTNTTASNIVSFYGP